MSCKVTTKTAVVLKASAALTTIEVDLVGVLIFLQ